VTIAATYCRRGSVELDQLSYCAKNTTFDGMSWRLALFALALLGKAGATQAIPPLYDPVILNIGLNCQWQLHCMSDQRQAMQHALKYVSKYHPPLWRIHQCNRNASRSRWRVDWSGFNNCVRNAALMYEPPRRAVKRHGHAGRHHHAWSHR
jgi:hypothetical protein